MRPGALNLLRLLWLSLPVTVGPAVEDALRGVSSPVAWVAAVGLWLAWAAALLALLVPRVVSLTVLRVGAPGVAVVAVFAAVRGGVDGLDLLAVAVAAVVLVMAAWPTVGAELVDGSSYGPERRLPLRVPPSLAPRPGPPGRGGRAGRDLGRTAPPGLGAVGRRAGGNRRRGRASRSSRPGRCTPCRVDSSSSCPVGSSCTTP